MLISQNLSFRSRLLVNDIPQPPQSLVVLFNFNCDFRRYYRFFKIEHCRALVFTVVDFHLEPTLPQILKTLFLPACVLRIKVHFDIQKLTIKFDIAFALFASRLSRLHTCVFDSCALSQPSHESCTSSLSNLCLAFVFYTLAFWNC